MCLILLSMSVISFHVTAIVFFSLAFPLCETRVISQLPKVMRERESSPRLVKKYTDKNDHTQPLGTVWDFLVEARSQGL